MSGRGKSKQARSKGLKEDRISELPDPLVCQIISHLSTKEAVQTSVLSTRWRHLWLWLPCLVLQSQEFAHFDDYKSFGDRFLDSDRLSCLHQLKLTLPDLYKDFSFLTSWIDAAVKRKLQHLHLWGKLHSLIVRVPMSLYSCETLVFLKLSHVTLDDTQFVSLPCLKTLDFMYVWCSCEATFERLVSSCPILEELKIFGWESHRKFNVMRLYSLSVKQLQISHIESNTRFQVVIDAPQLRYLRIHDNETESYIVNNLDFFAKLDISLLFGLDKFAQEIVSSHRKSIRDFLPGISKVGEMVIDFDTFQVFHLYSKLEPLPQFDYISRLDATLCPTDLEWLPSFLMCCPNLNSLLLALRDFYGKIDSEEVKQLRFSYVPECLLSSLKSVDINSDISGFAVEMKLVRYFLENSAILRKLTLRVNDRANVNVISKKLQKTPRRSITCQVVVR